MEVYVDGDMVVISVMQNNICPCVECAVFGRSDVARLTAGSMDMSFMFGAKYASLPSQAPALLFQRMRLRESENDNDVFAPLEQK